MRMPIVRIVLPLLLMAGIESSETATADPKQLFARAKALQQENKIDEALAAVAKAEALLSEEAPNPAQRAELLDYHVFLLVARSKQSAMPSDEMWRQEALPLATEALAIMERSKATQDDLATALETKAEALGPTTQAEKLWSRSTAIRKRLVEGSVRDQDSKPCENNPKPSELQTSSQRAVVFSFVVDASGKPTHIKLVRGVGFGLDETAARAFSCWRFKLGSQGGHPVSVPATAEFKFSVVWPPIEPDKAEIRQPPNSVREVVISPH